MNEQQSIEIEGNLEFNDLFRNVFWQTFKKLWFIFFLALILTPMGVFGIYLSIANSKFNPLIIMPFLPFLAVILSVYGVYSGAKKAFDSTKGKLQYSFSENGYDIFSPVGKSELGWASLEEIQEKSKEFLLYPQKPVFFVIPKRWFDSEAQIDEFRHLVRSVMGKRAKVKS